MKSILKQRGGFTVLELVIFSAIFTMTAIAFISILITMTRVQLRQGAAAEVNQQSQFLLQTIQRYVEQSSLVETDAGNSTTSLKLRMSNPNYDPTRIYLSGTTIYIQESSTPAQALTSNRVNITDLSFIKKSNPGGKDSVAISFAMEYNTQNPQSRFLQALQTSVARVSAAQFDSNLIPSAANTYKLGTAAGDWQSINNTVFFNGSNVGIGATSPTAKLQVNNGDVYVDTYPNSLVMKDAGGSCWRLRVATGTGSLSTASTTCP